MSAKESALKEDRPEVPEEKESDSRDRSTIGFPYLSLEDSVEIAKAVHALGGSTCQWDQLAAHFQQAANGGGFRMRLLTAKMFGILTYDRGIVTLTQLGSRVADPEQEKTARAEAFLKIPLYNRVYEEFKGATLPPTSGLETAMGNMGVAPKQKGKARQVFQRSAKEAGFFDFGSARLVMPSIKASAATPAPAVEPNEETPPDKKKKKDDGEGEKHPLIDGLLKELPEPQSEWTTEDRKKWLELASGIFNMIYKDSDASQGSLKVVIEKNSAK